MSGDGSEFEYPDAAGYPDGMGTLHEGVDDATDASTDEGSDAGSGEGDDQADDEAATEAEGDLETFALDDEEDVEGV